MDTDDKTVTETRPVTSLDEPAGGGVCLLFVHREGMSVVRLVADQTMVVGRRFPANVVIEDSSLSRQHVSFALQNDGLWVEDLNSTNGTLVNGKAVTRGPVSAGDEVQIGAVRVSVLVVGPEQRQQHKVMGHDQFMSELGDELARSRSSGNCLSLICIRPLRPEQTPLGHWCPTVQRLLRPFDRMGLYSPWELELIVPEATQEQAQALARAICEAGEPMVCGVGHFPESATSADELLAVTRAALGRASAGDPLQIVSPPVGERSEYEGIVVASDSMRQVMKLVERVASSRVPVLIVGETGTGKEVVAQAIHQRSSMRAGPLRCINCGAIPDQLIESALFGHERGAFTGACKQSKGIFEQADGGTVLLDEIGELAPAAQAALLRVLENKVITRVGSSREVEVDVRVLAATHRDLEQMCETGEFRSDLLYRLNTMTISVPALRGRRAGILPLVQHFINRANTDNGCKVTGISGEVEVLLQQYPWPGNVRQLRNVIERGVVLAQRGELSAEDLPGTIRDCKGPVHSLHTASSGDVARDTSAELNGTKKVGQPRPPEDDEQEDEQEDAILQQNRPARALRNRVKDFERGLIQQALGRAEWNHAQAARDLQLPLRTLFYKVQQYNIEREDRDSGDDSAPPLDTETCFKDQVAAFEVHTVQQALDQARGDRNEAARLLGIAPRTLAKRIRILGMNQ